MRDRRISPSEPYGAVTSEVLLFSTEDYSADV